MFVCNNCGNMVEELPTTTQYHGNTAFGELTEVIADCCSCGGEYIEATQCAICSKWFDGTDMDGVCESCIEDHETVGVALEMGDEDLKTIDGINGFVASCLSVEQMNKILKKWVEENFIDHSKDVVKYCEEDKQYFSEYIIEYNEE